MKRNAFVWRKSIYDNNFRCNRCGTELFDQKKGELVKDNVGFSPKFDKEVFCIKCKNHVAHIEEIEYDGEETLLGEWKGNPKK